MKIQLRQGSETQTLKAQSFKKAYILIQSVGNAVNVPATTSDIDLTKINISIEICQEDVFAVSSFNGVAPTVLGALKQMNVNSVDSVNFAVSGLTCQGQEIQVASTTTKSLNNVYIPILYGGYILNGSDYIKINVNTNPGFFGAGVSNTSSFYLVTEESLDITQPDVNIPYYYPITIDKINPQFSEKSASEIYLINSLPTYTFATQPFNSIEIRSKYVNDRFDNFTLETKSSQDGNGRTTDFGSNKIYVVEPSTLEDLQVNLDVDTTLVTNGAQWLYFSRTCVSKEMTSKAISHARKVNQRKAILRGFGPELGKGVMFNKRRNY